MLIFSFLQKVRRSDMPMADPLPLGPERSGHVRVQRTRSKCRRSSTVLHRHITAPDRTRTGASIIVSGCSRKAIKILRAPVRNFLNFLLQSPSITSGRLVQIPMRTDIPRFRQRTSDLNHPHGGLFFIFCQGKPSGFREPEWMVGPLRIYHPCRLHTADQNIPCQQIKKASVLQ